jgi:hypothetical protein
MTITIVAGSKAVRGFLACVALFLVAAAPACGTITAADGEVLDVDSPPSIEVIADGGIAALHIVNRVDSATAQVQYSVGPMCPETGSCQPRDTLTGQLTREQVDALYLRAVDPEFRALRADYGTTTQGADMMGYTVIIRGNDRTRTLRADDGTMPSLLAQWVNDVRSAVVEAVRR